MKPKQKIVIITGVSGSGKTTISKIFPLERRLVSYTTRQPRPGEKDGIDYYFITKKQSEEIENSENSFEKTIFAGNHYGLTIDEVLDKSESWKYPTVLVAEAGFYDDVSEKNGEFFYKDEYPIRPIIVKAENHKIISAIKERGGEDAKQRILDLAKEEKTIIDLKERFPGIEQFDVLLDMGEVANQKRFEDFLGYKKPK
jgi:guanylate kinase